MSAGASLPVSSASDPSEGSDDGAPRWQPALRWLCLAEADALSEGGKLMWSGCGLEPQSLVGRRVAVERLGSGTVTAFRQGGWLGSGRSHSLELADGRTKEVKLLREGSGREFSVEDRRPASAPWRWSFDAERPDVAEGHYGNLSLEQSQAVEQFRADVGDLNLDARVAVRFLRARSWQLEGAVAQWEKSVVWRKTEHVDELCRDTYEPPKVCASQLQLQALYPHICCGFDRAGRPVRIECMGRIEVAELYKHCTEAEICRYHVWQQEEIVQRFLPACNRRTGLTNDQVTVVIDMSRGRLRELMRAEAREHIKNFVTIVAEYYPEILSKMLVVNAPSMLSLAWDCFSPMIDAGTKKKIVIVPPGARTKCALLEVIHPSQLPCFLGGERNTALDLILPIIDAGGSVDEVEAVAKREAEWDGYWGLRSSRGAHVTDADEGDGARKEVAATQEKSQQEARQDGVTAVQRRSRDAQIALLLDREWTYRSLLKHSQPRTQE